MLNYDKVKRIPLYQIAINRLAYTPIAEKDSQLWKCLESPTGHKIITRATPNTNGHFVFTSPSHDVSGTIIDLLTKLHEFSTSDIEHFFKGEAYEVYKPGIQLDTDHKTWLSTEQVRQMYLQICPSTPNVLSKKGITVKTLQRFRIKASNFEVIFPLYRLKKANWVACSAIQYKYDGKKYFKGPRALSLLSSLNRKQLKNPTVYFFESPIDALAYAQIEKVQDNSVLVSFCGLPTHDFYMNLEAVTAYFKATSYQICLDNDKAGRKATQKLSVHLPTNKTKAILPPKEHKDWASFLSGS